MTIKIIRSESDYQDALRAATQIARSDPDPGTQEADTLEILILLIEGYEKKHFKFDVPDPVSAIEFRMEEQGLRQRDLVPILGSRSRVSEVLNRKRPLTLPMIRSLSENLGISADILIQPSTPTPAEQSQLMDWQKFPFKEMQKRGWIPKASTNSSKEVAAKVEEFISQASGHAAAPLFRRSLKGLGTTSMGDRATCSVIAWTARVLQRANEQSVADTFQLSSLSMQSFMKLAQLSTSEDGPLLAIKELNKIGIRTVVEPQLPGTLIDGAAILNNELQPIIGLTLRFDRIDYFWFTLFHELSHIWKHLNHPNEGFIDRIDADEDRNRIEKEADRIARDAIIPRDRWTRSPLRIAPSISAIHELASELQIHSALVAGRVRYETKDYRKFSKLVGQGKVRRLFST